MITNPKSIVPNQKKLRPPQFGLRTLLAFITVIATLLAVREYLDPIAVFAVGFLAISIFFHIAGNAIGTRLREIGSQAKPDDGGASQPRLCPRPQDFAPATHLGQRRSLGWTIIVTTSVGIACGAIGGGLWTFLSGQGQADALNIAVGVIAFAVLGGLAAFATVGFSQVLVGAIWQAMKQGE